MTRTQAETMPSWARPIRISEGVDVTHADPPFALAGETSTWHVPFRISEDVPGGGVLMFQLYSQRSNKGMFADAQTERVEGDGYIAAELEGGVRLAMRADGGRTLWFPGTQALPGNRM